MNDQLGSTAPEPRKVGVWTEGAGVEAKESIIPNKFSDSSDDIPTIPDLDDLQDILEKEISIPPVSNKKDTETLSALTEIGGGIGSTDGIDAVVEILRSYIPQVEVDTADTIWTVDTLITQLADEMGESLNK